MSEEENPNIGPHDDRELELMLAGRKPLAMFTEVLPLESGLIPEADFAPHVASGRLTMREVLEHADKVPYDQRELHVRRVLYALPGNEWRIDAMILACQVAASLRKWDEGLERVIGKLLGYEDRQIDAFIKKVLR